MEFAQVSCRSTRRGVREHPAPSGALRRDLSVKRFNHAIHLVREHPAPSGALRQAGRDLARDRIELVREHPAPSGALRPPVQIITDHDVDTSGSTQHHQVH
ncbi:hypothetical protein HMPREF1550_02085 [Actinomyces sp. oral taxon 877 str. F0543]|nr:hypothetical protein HMPREF1550_02085 [Actinomyces sp. oral taxon 877 str. F0543]